MEQAVNLTEKTYLTRKNKLSFAWAGFGQNLIINFVNSYILFFYTDIFLIGAAPAGILMIVARIWDALNDPIMGTIVDKTRSRWGKMRPYLLFIPIPLALSTIALFIVPHGFSNVGKIVYAYITYIIWGMIYTVCDVPFWGLPSALTPNPKERLSFISFSRLFHAVGGASVMLILPLITGLVGDQSGYTLAAVLIGIVGADLFYLAFFGTSERNKNLGKAPTLKECVKYLKINKPLQCVVGANILGFMRSMPVVAGMYVATYLVKERPFNINGATLNTVIVASWAVAGYIGMIFTPKICAKINYRQIYYISAVVGAAFSVALFFVGSNMYFIMTALLFCGLCYGVSSNVNYSMIADSVEYVEWKTGKRAEGVTASFQTLMNKTMSAFQTGLVALILLIINFKQPVEINGETIQQIQSQTVLNGLFFSITILPAIGWILSALPMKFYTFVGAEREKAAEELALRRSEAEAAEVIVKDEAPVTEVGAVSLNDTDAIYDSETGFADE
ncbi:MAG: glycoside-pentoside-hexuronide (GPH):cation symporter [Clostridiales bacterium]|jgi:sugar (glycoside-pentoside-hexuronide) transporter|nr:glycoside-pentoside-hexuronide (GPH):cation symporter [Clostridiales bacterium]